MHYACLKVCLKHACNIISNRGSQQIQFSLKLNEHFTAFTLAATFFIRFTTSTENFSIPFVAYEVRNFYTLSFNYQ